MLRLQNTQELAVLGDFRIYSRAKKSQCSVLRGLLESLGKRHAYEGQMKSMTPHSITGLERLKSL
jgi:hypothetical protein